MEDKYYTPDISEFYVGFEYWFSSAWQEGVSMTEIVIDGRDGYEPKVFDFGIYNYIRNKGESWKDLMDNLLSHDQIKVKYLDKEDIETLGFKYNDNSRIYSKGEYKLMCSFKDAHHLRIWTNEANVGYSDTIFFGFIKNKSELIKLLKQLGIDGSEI